MATGTLLQMYTGPVKIFQVTSRLLTLLITDRGGKKRDQDSGIRSLHLAALSRRGELKRDKMQEPPPPPPPYWEMINYWRGKKGQIRLLRMKSLLECGETWEHADFELWEQACTLGLPLGAALGKLAWAMDTLPHRTEMAVSSCILWGERATCTEEACPTEQLGPSWPCVWGFEVVEG